MQLLISLLYLIFYGISFPMYHIIIIDLMNNIYDILLIFIINLQGLCLSGQQMKANGEDDFLLRCQTLNGINILWRNLLHFHFIYTAHMYRTFGRLRKYVMKTIEDKNGGVATNSAAILLVRA